MDIHIIVFDHEGMHTGEIPIPEKTIAVTIKDGDREITYDPESYEVTLTKGDKQVQDFSDDLVPVEVGSET